MAITTLLPNGDSTPLEWTSNPIPQPNHFSVVADGVDTPNDLTFLSVGKLAGFGKKDRLKFQNIKEETVVSQIALRIRSSASFNLPTVVGTKIRYYINGVLGGSAEAIIIVPGIPVNRSFPFSGLSLSRDQINSLEVEIESSGSGWDGVTFSNVQELEAVVTHTPIEPVRQIPVSLPGEGVNSTNMFAGQTEPPLVKTLVGGRTIGLNAVEHSVQFSMANHDTGASIVSGAVAVLSFDADGDPKFTYAWATADTLASGVYDGQYRVVRNADGRIMFQDTFPLYLHSTV